MAAADGTLRYAAYSQRPTEGPQQLSGPLLSGELVEEPHPHCN